MKKAALTLTIAGWAVSAWNIRAAAPPNDTFANRISVVGSRTTVSGSNTEASKETGEPDHAGNVGGKSVWWTWAAPAEGDLTMTTDGSSFDTLLAVYTGSSLSTLSAVATNDDHGVQITSRVRFHAAGGTQYHIAVDGYNDGTNENSGSIMMNLVFLSEPILRPSNDNFADREFLSGAAVTTNGSNEGATRETGEPLHAQVMGDTSVWWRWTAPATSAVRIGTAGSSFDTLLAVYSGSSLSNLAEVASNDDIDSAQGILTSGATFDALAGNTYEIVIDGFDGATGQITLHIQSGFSSLSAPARRPDGTFQFTLDGLAGAPYRIDGSEDLADWSVVATLVNTNGLVVVEDPAATNFNRRFYRALLQP
jgi:hypothetical protein